MSNRKDNSKNRASSISDLDPDKPLSVDELSALFDEAVKSIGAESHEESERRRKEIAEWEAADPKFKAAMDGLRELFPPDQPKRVSESQTDAVDDLPRDVQWNRSRPPMPRRPFDLAWADYFWQRGATLNYLSADGDSIEWSRRGWRKRPNS